VRALNVEPVVFSIAPDKAEMVSVLKLLSVSVVSFS